jgi:UDPglucose 6-dehydrogenase
VWGLAYKAGTDDIRESPAISIIEELIDHHANVVAYDPKAMENTKAILGDKIAYADNAIKAAKDADVIAILTEWPEFKNINIADLQMRNKRIVDLRNIINPKTAMENGFSYKGIGI